MLVDAGLYLLTNNFTVASTNGGSVVAHVWIRGVPGKTILDRGAPNTSSSACLVISAPFVTVENFTCLGAYYGIQVNANNCSLLNNTVSGCGFHGIYVNNAPNGVLADNVVVHSGAGAAVNLGATCTFINNTVVATNADGIATTASGAPHLKNNIVQVSGSGRCCISASDITGISSSDFNDLCPKNGAKIGKVYQANAGSLFAWRALTSWDAHSISVDPLFANPASNDFHLKSASGRYDPSTGKPLMDPAAWVTDSATSLAIDAGDPSDAIGTESLPNGGRINLGAFGGTDEASRSSTAARSVNILSPSGGEIWGGFQPVELRTAGNGRQPGDVLRLEYSDDQGASWRLLPAGSNVPYTQKRFWWDTRTVPDRNGYLVRASFVQDVQASGVSAGLFAIANGLAPATVNDAPSFTTGADQTVSEDSGPQTVKSWAAAIRAGPPDEAIQKLTFFVNSDNNALFASTPAIDATGTLTYTPAPNANGVAHLTVTLKDDGGTANGGVDTSAPQSFNITVQKLELSSPRLSDASLSGNVFSVLTPTVSGKTYVLEFKSSLTEDNGTPLATFTGDGTVKTLTDPDATDPQGFYRVRME